MSCLSNPLLTTIRQQERHGMQQLGLASARTPASPNLRLALANPRLLTAAEAVLWSSRIVLGS